MFLFCTEVIVIVLLQSATSWGSYLSCRSLHGASLEAQKMPFNLITLYISYNCFVPSPPLTTEVVFYSNVRHRFLKEVKISTHKEHSNILQTQGAANAQRERAHNEELSERRRKKMCPPEMCELNLYVTRPRYLECRSEHSPEIIVMFTVDCCRRTMSVNNNTDIF